MVLATIRLVILAACIRQSTGQQSLRAHIRSRTNYASGCVNADDNRDLLIQSVVHLAGSLSPTNLHIVFQRDPDLCLMESLWRGNIAAQILTEKGLWDALKKSHYQIPTEIILYGDAPWMSSSVGKAASYYDSAKLNAMITRWLWVDETIYNGGFTNHGPLSNLTSPSVPSNFLEAMDFVSSSLKEGMRGLFIAANGRSLLSDSSLSPPEKGLLRWVNIASIEAPGDGLWKLEFSGSWTSQGLRILRPLWPGVSFNLLGRTIRISCLKKPTVFDYEGEATHLKETNGYAADIAKEIQQRLNFTDILVRSDGFGAFADGKWNGMVGDLYEKKADVSPTDFTPIWQRTLVIDFGLSYGTDPVVIISKAPSVYMKPLLLLEIFTLDAWVCIMGIGLVAGAATGALMKIKQALGHPSTGVVLGPLAYAAGYMSVIVSQPSDENCWTSWIGGQVIGGCVMFFSVVLGSLYKSLVTAFLAIPFRSQPINSLEDMLRRNVIPAIRLLSSPYSFFLFSADICCRFPHPQELKYGDSTATLDVNSLNVVFLVSDSETVTSETENSGKVGERVRNIMVTFSGIEVSEWKFMKKVADGTYAWIDTASSAIGSSNQFEAIGKPCLYYVAHNPVRIDLDAFAYPKNSIVKYQFDEIMKWLRNYGIIEKMKKTYYEINCITVKASNGPQVINIAQVQAAFYILGIGFALAGFVLLVEGLVFLWTKKR